MRRTSRLALQVILTAKAAEDIEALAKRYESDGIKMIRKEGEWRIS